MTAVRFGLPASRFRLTASGLVRRSGYSPGGGFRLAGGCFGHWRWRGLCGRRDLLTTDNRNDGVDRNRLAFLDLDLRQHAGPGGRDFRVHLVGRDLEERLVAIDAVADLLDPADNGPLGDRLAHLGHHNV